MLGRNDEQINFAPIKRAVLPISEIKLSAGPKIEIKNSRLHDGKAQFLIDMESELNLLKESCIIKNRRRNKSDIFHLTGIAQGTQKTRGSIKLKIFERVVKFHLVRKKFPISTCGILGIEFLRENLASLKFTNEDVTLNLPLSDTVSPCSINLPPRRIKCVNRHLYRGKSSKTPQSLHKGICNKYHTQRHASNYPSRKTSGI